MSIRTEATPRRVSRGAIRGWSQSADPNGFSIVQNTPWRSASSMSDRVTRTQAPPSTAVGPEAEPVVRACEKLVHGVPKWMYQSDPPRIHPSRTDRTRASSMSKRGPLAISNGGAQRRPSPTRADVRREVPAKHSTHALAALSTLERCAGRSGGGERGARREHGAAAAAGFSVTSEEAAVRGRGSQPPGRSGATGGGASQAPRSMKESMKPAGADSVCPGSSSPRLPHRES